MAGHCAGALRKLASPSTPRLLSTVAKGTHFEEATARALLDIGMSLERWGAGAHDQGLDLRGTWALPGQSTVPVAVQCKHEARPSGVAHVRDFAGALAQWEQADAALPTPRLGILACTAGFSTPSTQLAMRTPRPLALACLSPQGLLSQLLFNPAAAAAWPGVTVVAAPPQHPTWRHGVLVLYDGHILTRCT